MRFILVDPSLGQGLHDAYHQDYDSSVLTEAEGRGMKTFVGVSYAGAPAGFSRPGRTIIPAFLHAAPWAPDLERLTADRAAFASHVQAFRDGCRLMLDRVGFRPHDIAFVPMAALPELLGLDEFLTHDLPSRRGRWHVQFHYYPHPDALPLLLRGLELGRRHRVAFHTTHERLTAAYNALGRARFSTLPHPVNRRLAPTRRVHARPRLRLTLAGLPRANKRYAMRAFLEACRPHLIAGRIQLLIQDRSAAAGSGRSRPWLTSSDPVVRVPFPLPPAEYRMLVRHSDVGLLLYRPHVFAERCSGVLNEMLACGVPVLVPAGCALADPLEAPTQAHRARLRRTHPPSRSLTARGTTLRTTLPASAAHLAVGWSFPSRRKRGDGEPFARVAVEFYDRHRARIEDMEEVLATGPSRSATTPTTRALFHVPGAAVRTRVSVHGLPSGSRIHLEFGTGSRPSAAALGAVGRTFSTPSRIAPALDELITQWSHYRRTALRFSAQWRALHSAGALLDQLVSPG